MEANLRIDSATAFEAIPVFDPRSIDAWAIQLEGKTVGAAWTDTNDEGELFFHITIIDGKIYGKAKLLNSLIPTSAWMTVPLSMRSAARYLVRYVDGMEYRGTVHKEGKAMLALQRV